MKFVREALTATTIRHVERGRVVVGDTPLTEDFMLFRGQVFAELTDTPDSLLDVAEFGGVIAESPEIVIYGGGFGSVLPPTEVVFALARKGIGFEAMDTPAACRTYNILIGEDRDVAAYFRVR